MNRRILECIQGLTLIAGVLLTSTSVQAQITFIGTGSLPGTATDLSGLSGIYTAGDGSGSSAQNQLGAFGSGLAYTGFNNIYVGVNDRGFGNGTTSPNYLDRFHLFQVNVNPTTNTVTPTLLATRFFTNENGMNLVGNTSAFNPSNPTAGLRFDPESVRVGKDGSLFVSDEYGPYIYQFDQTGKRICTISVPGKYGIANPNADGAVELSNNTIGRQSNRGMEGLAISPNGTKLFGLMQNPLLQDGALNANLRRIGVYTRILEVDLITGQTHEYIYKLDSGTNYGVNDIVAVNDHEFLVIERDGNAGNNAAFKRIYDVDLTGATDISTPGAGYDYTGTTVNNGLPSSGSLAAGVNVVTKTPFINLLDSAYGLKGSTFPEKIEGLAFGPDFSNGDHLLLVTNDNDLFTTQPNNFYAFRIGTDSLPDFQAQTLVVPFAVPEPGISSLFVGLTAVSAGVLLKRRKR